MENMNQNQTTENQMSTKKVIGISAGVFIGLSLASAAVRKAMTYFKGSGEAATTK